MKNPLLLSASFAALLAAAPSASPGGIAAAVAEPRSEALFAFHMTGASGWIDIRHELHADGLYRALNHGQVVLVAKVSEKTVDQLVDLLARSDFAAGIAMAPPDVADTAAVVNLSAFGDSANFAYEFGPDPDFPDGVKPVATFFFAVMAEVLSQEW